MHCNVLGYLVMSFTLFSAKIKLLTIFNVCLILTLYYIILSKLTKYSTLYFHWGTNVLANISTGGQMSTYPFLDWGDNVLGG